MIKMKNKNLIISVLGVFLLLGMMSLVAAANPNMGTFKQTECIDLRQICFINGTICDGCNITSIDYPKNGSAFLRDVQMTKNTNKTSSYFHMN